MLTIHLGNIEYFDSKNNQFEYTEGGTVNFEYTLKVVYDWECKWRKPFLKGGLTEQELVDFYKMMAIETLDEKFLTTDVMIEIAEYIAKPNTATTFANHSTESSGPNKPTIYTAESIYAMMFSASIPIEFENRNLNRLLIILRIISSYNEPPKKMSKQEIFKQNASLNAQRKAQLKTKG